MSGPILRRSGRNSANKDVSIPLPAPASKKRASAEPKKSAAKKLKSAADPSAITPKTDVKTPAEADFSSESVVATHEKPRRSLKAAGKAAEKLLIKPAALKSASEGLKDGDFIPDDLPEIQTEDGRKITIGYLLKDAQKGIIIFAYPRASTPGCTTQACLFRDSFTAFSDAGYTIYGLSGDSPAANEKFKSKHNLSYTLLCDQTYELHQRFSIKKKPKGTIRSVVIIEKEGVDGHFGKVLRISPASPQISLQIAKEAVRIDHASMIAAAATANEAGKTPAGDQTNVPISDHQEDTVA